MASILETLKSGVGALSESEPVKGVKEVAGGAINKIKKAKETVKGDVKAVGSALADKKSYKAGYEGLKESILKKKGKETEDKL